MAFEFIPPQQTGSIGADFKSKSFTKADIETAETTSTGWRVFKNKITLGDKQFDTINTARIFKTPADFTRQRDSLLILCNTHCDGFFDIAVGENGFADTVDEYGVFSFSMNSDCIPLKDIPDKKSLARSIFVALLKIICDYSSSTVCNDGYLPLRCICEDSIYLSKINGEWQIKLLPITATRDCPEFGYRLFDDKKNDIAVDLFSAAYLYFKLLYQGQDYPRDYDEEQLLIERCLSFFPEHRPSFKELLDYFEFESNGDAIIFDPPVKESSIPVNRVPKETDDPVDSIKNYLLDTVNGFANKFLKKGVEPKPQSPNEDGTIE